MDNLLLILGIDVDFDWTNRFLRGDFWSIDEFEPTESNHKWEAQISWFLKNFDKIEYLKWKK